PSVSVRSPECHSSTVVTVIFVPLTKGRGWRLMQAFALIGQGSFSPPLPRPTGSSIKVRLPPLTSSISCSGTIMRRTFHNEYTCTTVARLAASHVRARCRRGEHGNPRAANRLRAKYKGALICEPHPHGSFRTRRPCSAPTAQPLRRKPCLR